MMIGMSTLTCTGHDVLLDGTESWPVLGSLLSQSEANYIIGKCKGMKRYWHCLEKAKIVAETLKGNWVVVIGTMHVACKSMKSSYGFDYNPPLEFHAWCENFKGGVIDIALPGVIEVGLKTKDKYGPFIIRRKPVILATNKVPNWLIYRAKEML